jgi:hypothetical protein
MRCPASSAAIVTSAGTFFGPNAMTEAGVSSGRTRIIGPFLKRNRAKVPSALLTSQRIVSVAKTAFSIHSASEVGGIVITAFSEMSLRGDS